MDAGARNLDSIFERGLVTTASPGDNKAGTGSNFTTIKDVVDAGGCDNIGLVTVMADLALGEKKTYCRYDRSIRICAAALALQDNKHVH